MRAQQSNNASGRRGLSSPFTTPISLPITPPIQVARMYIERQRAGDPASSDDISGGSSPEEFGGGLDAFAHPASRSHETAESPESGVGEELFLDPTELDVLDEDLIEREDAAAQPPPDEAVVRAAIFRLARESKWTRRIAARGFAPETRLQSSGPPSSHLPEWNPVSETEDKGRSSTTAEALHEPPAKVEGAGAAMDFEDVALWVWRESPEAQAAEAEESVNDIFASAGTASPGRGEAISDEEAAREEVEAVMPRPATVEARDKTAAWQATLDVTGGPALAHDAGNLLSAMGLYSELLSLSGVLQADHRHYAEDLKLLVGRSHVLIERLLQLSCMTASCGGVSGTAQDDSDRPPVAVVSAGGIDASADVLLEQRGAAVATRTNGQVSARQEVRQAAETKARPGMQTGLQAGTRSDVWPSVRPGVRLRAGGGAASRTADLPASLKVMKVDGGEVSPSVSEGPDICAVGTNLAELLTRWSSLLATIGCGAVTVELGPLAGLPIAVPVEALERIVVNLVRNATEAIRQGGAIRIGVGAFEREIAGAARSGVCQRRTMVLRVDDSGCGMSDSQLRQVIDGVVHMAWDGGLGKRFGERWNERRNECGNESANGSRDERGGPRRGLGLRIVRELVATSGGEMFIQSQHGKGTRIEIQWPVAEAVAVVTGSAASTEPRTYVPQEPIHGPRTKSVRTATASSRLAALALRSSPFKERSLAIAAALAGPLLRDVAHEQEGFAGKAAEYRDRHIGYRASEDRSYRYRDVTYTGPQDGLSESFGDEGAIAC